MAVEVDWTGKPARLQQCSNSEHRRYRDIRSTTPSVSRDVRLVTLTSRDVLNSGNRPAHSPWFTASLLAE